MPRPIRIYYPGLIYHVLNRGNKREPVFLNDDDYQHYLDILKRYKEKFEFKIFAYCLMDNHMHLLLKVSEKASISKIMQTITIAHTRRFHQKYRTSGHIWQGRFKSPLVSADEYLLTLMRYIEQNPVRAGIVKHPKQFQFSSYKANTAIKNDGFVDKDDNPVFLGLGNTMEERTARYEQFASELLNEDNLKLIRKTLGGQTHYTSEKFLRQIQEILSHKREMHRGRPRQKRINT